MAESSYEDQLPSWQKHSNAFLENWIFAFIIAMVIRQFFLEPFSIPSASMEPMLLGSQKFWHSDHVVVNKLSLRYSESQRWDVTVFEFPIPEYHNKYGQEQQIFFDDNSSEGSSHWLSRPLLHRNFVKRMVVMPGDEFFVSAGDIYINGANGGEGFDVPQKERILQDALWQAVYEHGVEDDYLPWSAGAVADADNGQLQIHAQKDRAVIFTQPLSNLYMKEWAYNVVPAQQPFAQPARVTISMCKPLFHYKGRQGNAWDLKTWSINRLSAADLDSNKYGTNLNSAMNEYIGDMRIVFNCSSISGKPELNIIDRDGVVYRLQISENAWSLSQLSADRSIQKVIATGNDGLIGKRLALCHLDKRVWFEIDGKPMHESLKLPPCKNVDATCRIHWTGEGQVVLDQCLVERDVHYCRSGFLEDLSKSEYEYRKHAHSLEKVSNKEKAGSRLQKNVALWDGDEQGFNKQMERVVGNAQGVHQRAVQTRDRQILIRERLLGRPCRAHEKTKPIGDSPQSALIAPDNAYLLFGDNSPFSWDSRNWGWVPGTNIRGRAAWVVFPIPRWKTIR
ncbi:MAG: signal peptidase I [Planctomycetes bacterium]|nr:signal peptidase I [Planctomycetota bacterium]